MENVQKLPSVREFFAESWERYKSRFNDLISVSLIFFLVSIVFGFFFAATDEPTISMLVFALAMGVVAVWTEIALVYVLDENLRFSDALKKSPGKILLYLGTSILSGLAVIFGLVLLIVPGVIFMAWFSLTGLIVVLENLGGIKAMKKSRSYVEGHTWEVILRGLVVMIIFIIASSIGNVFSSYSQIYADFFSSVVLLFLSPFITTCLYTLYKNLKVIKTEPPVIP